MLRYGCGYHVPCLNCCTKCQPGQDTIVLSRKTPCVQGAKGQVFWPEQKTVWLEQGAERPVSHG